MEYRNCKTSKKGVVLSMVHKINKPEKEEMTMKGIHKTNSLFDYSKKEEGHIFQDALTPERYWRVDFIYPDLNFQAWKNIGERHGLEESENEEHENLEDDYEASGKGLIIATEMEKNEDKFEEKMAVWNDKTAFWLNNSGYFDGAVKVE
jgi:hypothetical protein